MNESKLDTIEQIQEFLTGTTDVEAVDLALFHATSFLRLLLQVVKRNRFDSYRVLERRKARLLA